MEQNKERFWKDCKKKTIFSKALKKGKYENGKVTNFEK